MHGTLVIGAGAAGLPMARHLKASGLPFSVFETHTSVGGMWDYSRADTPIYASTRLISSKKMSQYPDFPMAKSLPDYLSHQQAHEYLQRYAEHFELLSHIDFGVQVEQIEPTDKGWIVSTSDGLERQFENVIVATGHLNKPHIPDRFEAFSGDVLHSKSFDTPDRFAGKRVLIVGAGNSGCDIAVEISKVADAVFHSTRRGYYYIPRMLFGSPTDYTAELMIKFGLPAPLRRAIQLGLLRMVQPNPTDVGLPAPDHQILESHPIINGRILDVIKSGGIIPRPDVQSIQGQTIMFTDGSSAEVDVLLCATGYEIDFPFVAQEHLNWVDNRPNFYLYMFHPRYDSLFMQGLIQPDSGSWWMYDLQAQAITAYLLLDEWARYWFDEEKRQANPDMGAGRKYVQSRRHALEVEHHSYAQRLKKLIKRLHQAARLMPS